MGGLARGAATAASGRLAANPLSAFVYVCLSEPSYVATRACATALGLFTSRLNTTMYRPGTTCEPRELKTKSRDGLELGCTGFEASRHAARRNIVNATARTAELMATSGDDSCRPRQVPSRPVRSQAERANQRDYLRAGA